ncbi:MAG: lysophospholipid acyltransferase family protein [Acidocella sp.]|uniref:lysophospholipid acyltransferase family protein n=1 Tax=Acidocella sp. TaxID=50710 RepID=UPI003FD7012D
MAGARCYPRYVKKFLKSAPMQAALAWAVAAYIQLIVRTQRWRIEGEEHARTALTAPVVAALWHEALPASPVLWRLVRRLGMRRGVAVLASRHRDGQLIGNVMRHLGMELVSGSSSRGGTVAADALIQALAEGRHVAMTPDGPRGPRRVAAPGVARLAALSGAKVLPFGVWTSRAIPLNSWDKMRLPLPFGRGVLVVGAPISVEGPWEDALPRIQAALNTVQDKAAAG